MTAVADPTAIPSASLSVSCAPRLPTGLAPDRRAFVRQIMGMPISIHVRGPQARDERLTDAIEAVVEAAFADLTWVDDTFSLWQPDSQLSRVRRGELAVGDAAPQIAEVFGLCEEASRRTGGAFRWLWPDPDRPGELLVEPTGLVKGWAIERAAAILDGLEQVGDGLAFCLNAGGDIAVGGSDAAPGARPTPWRLGIEDPHAPGRLARVVELTRGGLATSGTAARGDHLLDPETGAPVSWQGSVSVWGPSPMWADVWATALFVGPLTLERDLHALPGWSVARY